MIVTEPHFYHQGGAVPPDAPSYIVRQADGELHAALMQGEFCYVLTARQMGKSSLMGRTAARLREEGVAVARLDLTAIGQNITPEQWYVGLLDHLGRQLDLEEELEGFWLAPTHLGPLQHWITALRQVVLPRCPGRLVIFIDEIDFVRSLPFKTDEFFAAIRECYNRRVDDPEFTRLTFCLLGVATPSDLIQDARTTPFNIGRRIDLTDFTREEAAPLANGLGQNEPTNRASLERVLYWTHGHPYLTQRLCQVIAESLHRKSSLGAVDAIRSDRPGAPRTLIENPTSEVDHLCEALFLSLQSRERDDNLLFVRDRLLNSEADRAALLDLYRQVRAAKQVRLDDTNELVSILRLSGITRVEEGALRVRNRIYEKVFDLQWVAAHVPDAELRRQQAAYRQALLRAAGVFGLILALLGGLALTTTRQARLAREKNLTARLAQTEKRLRYQYLYAERMNLVQQVLDAANAPRARALLEEWKPQPGQEDLRGFEWRYFWGLANRDDSRATIPTGQELFSVAYSPDGRLLTTCGRGDRVKLWEIPSRRLVASLPGFNGGAACAVFSPDGQLLAAVGSLSEKLDSSTAIKLWDLKTRRLLVTWKGADGVGSFGNLWGVGGVAFSPDGRLLAAATGALIRLWNVATRQVVATLPPAGKKTCRLAFSPDGRMLATHDDKGPVLLWDLRRMRQAAVLRGRNNGGWCVAFSPDGKTLAAGSQKNGKVRLWDVERRQMIGTLAGRGTAVFVTFSPDGKTIATAGRDFTIQLWDVATKEELAVLRGHQGGVAAVAFSPDGKMLASGSTDGTVKLWSAQAVHPDLIRLGVGFSIPSPDGTRLLTGDGKRDLRLWDVATKQVVSKLDWTYSPLNDGSISQDGRTVANGSVDGTLRLWNTRTRQVSSIGRLGGRYPFLTSGAFTPDGTLFAHGIDPHSVGLWDVATGRRVRTFTGHNGIAPPGVLFSPDGKLLATSSHDLTAKLWDVTSGRLVYTFTGHEGWVSPMAFSPDGRIFATVSGNDQVVNIWDVATKRKLTALKGHTQEIGWMEFSPDGKTLATGAFDHAIKLWSTTSWLEVATLLDPDLQAGSAAFSTDGRVLLTERGNGTIHAWRAPTFAEIEPQLARDQQQRQENAAGATH